MMGMMKKLLLMVVAAMMVTTSALAQFPDNVKEVLRKCDEKMDSYKSDAGMVLDMNMKAKVSILSVNGTVKSYVKNIREFSINEDVDNLPGNITITITQITKGCSDNWFKLDMNKYKNAVVVRQ